MLQRTSRYFTVALPRPETGYGPATGWTVPATGPASTLAVFPQSAREPETWRNHGVRRELALREQSLPLGSRQGNHGWKVAAAQWRKSLPLGSRQGNHGAIASPGEPSVHPAKQAHALFDEDDSASLFRTPFKPHRLLSVLM